MLLTISLLSPCSDKNWLSAGSIQLVSTGPSRVDVNEQNEQALGFYQHLGFSVIGRSPLDGQGKPYPLLHMELPAA